VAQNQQPNPSNQRRYKPFYKAKTLIEKGTIIAQVHLNNQTLRTKEGCNPHNQKGENKRKAAAAKVAQQQQPQQSYTTSMKI